MTAPEPVPDQTTRPWVGQAVVVGGVVLLGCVTAAVAASTVDGSTRLGLYQPGTSAAWLVPTAWLAGTAVAAALLLARRRWPLAVTAALTVLAVVSLAFAGVLGVVGVALACALFSVAATHPARTTWVTCAAVLAVVTVALWCWQDIGLAEILLWGDMPLTLDTPPARSLIEPPFSAGRRSASVSLLLALLLLGVATGTTARARRLHATDLADRYTAMVRERDTSAALARASERARIAREMHDIVAHSVSVMVALSDGAGAALDSAPERSREALRELSQTGRTALADMQHVLGALDPGASATDGTRVREAGLTENGPTETGLAATVDRFRTAGLPVTASGLDAALPHDIPLRLALVRVVTEALTNVLRHAPGAEVVDVGVRCGGGTVEVEVVDSGGTRPGTGGGSGRGVPGMQERAALLGGRAEAGPVPGGGWRVHVVLPCDEGGRP